MLLWCCQHCGAAVEQTACQSTSPECRVTGLHSQPCCRAAASSRGDDVTGSAAVPRAVIYELIWTCLLVLQVCPSPGTR
ncbi:hypothetical protein AOLI_G00097580 [Acnodon oligacanthus]